MTDNIIFINVVFLLTIVVIMIAIYKNMQKYNNTKPKAQYNLLKNYFINNAEELLSRQQDEYNEGKPILWIHVPYEYNSRFWENWGSRSSHKLNEPYLYLTAKTIIEKCQKDFIICIVDDNSFLNLVPKWSINLHGIPDPIKQNMRQLCLAKLLYTYGGLLCPISFLCLKNLVGLYNMGIKDKKMFIVENVCTTIHSTHHVYSPDISFMGALPKNETMKQLINYIQYITNTDFTSQSQFLGAVETWSKKHKYDINFISAKYIGRKGENGAPILLDDMLQEYYLPVDKNKLYGIYIPNNELLSRTNYSWFAYLSPQEVLQSNTIIGNYFLLANVPFFRINEPFYTEGDGDAAKANNPKHWVGFWKTPLYNGLWGQKPNYLGNNLITLPFAGP